MPKLVKSVKYYFTLLTNCGDTSFRKKSKTVMSKNGDSFTGVNGKIFISKYYLKKGDRLLFFAPLFLTVSPLAILSIFIP